MATAAAAAAAAAAAMTAASLLCCVSFTPAFFFRDQGRKRGSDDRRLCEKKLGLGHDLRTHTKRGSDVICQVTKVGLG